MSRWHDTRRRNRIERFRLAMGCTCCARSLNPCQLHQGEDNLPLDLVHFDPDQEPPQ